MAYSVNCISSESENYHNTMATFLGFKMIFAKKMFHDLSLSVPSSNQSIITIKWLHIYYDSVINNWNNLHLVVTMPGYDTYYMDSRGKEYWCVSEGSECRTCNVKIIKDKVLSGLLSGAHWLENLNTKFKQGRKLDQSNVMLWWTGRSKAECCRLSHSAGARIYSVLTGGKYNGWLPRISRCRASQDCPSFLLDYDKSACYRLDINTEGSRDIITPALSHSAYFEKICLRSPACEKAWIFERSVGFLLQGYDDRVVEGVAGRLDCEELCLIETEFPCASAEYDYSSAECRLSRHSRRSQPAAYRATTRDIDYLENQCVSQLPRSENCNYESYEDQDIGYPDIKIQAASATEVR